MQWQGAREDCCVQRGTFGEPTVLVVEDCDEERERLASVASQAFPNGCIFAAAGVRQSADVLLLQPVDIAVIDLDLPDGLGIQLVGQCFQLSPLTRCVVTTSHDEEASIIQALAAGALGYLLKDQPDIVLIQQLRLVAHGIPPLAPSVARRLLRYFAEQPATLVQSASEADPDSDLVQLSDREKQVLSLIAKGMQIGEVAPLLDITANTVCSHIKNIYRKRQVSSRAEAALEARRLGLV